MYAKWQTGVMVRRIREFIADPNLESLEPIALHCGDIQASCERCPYNIEHIPWCIYDRCGRRNNWQRRMADYDVSLADIILYFLQVLAKIELMKGDQDADADQ